MLLKATTASKQAVFLLEELAALEDQHAEERQEGSGRRRAASAPRPGVELAIHWG